MKKNFCKNREILSAYLDGMLPEELKGQVKEHIESCAECSQSVREMEVIQGLLAQYPEKEPGPGFETAIINRVKERERSVSLRNWFRRVSYSLGGLALLLITLIVIQKPSIQPPEKVKSPIKPEPFDESVVSPGETKNSSLSVTSKDHLTMAPERQEEKKSALVLETGKKREFSGRKIASASISVPVTQPAPQNIVIRNKKEWEGIWHTQNTAQNLSLPLPEVDFRKEMVIVLPSDQNGQEYQIVKTEEKEERLIVHYQVSPLKRDTTQTTLPPYQVKIVNTRPTVEFQPIK